MHGREAIETKGAGVETEDTLARLLDSARRHRRADAALPGGTPRVPAGVGKASFAKLVSHLRHGERAAGVLCRRLRPFFPDGLERAFLELQIDDEERHAALNREIRRDEARHVAFGRLVARSRLALLPQAERQRLFAWVQRLRAAFAHRVLDEMLLARALMASFGKPLDRLLASGARNLARAGRDDRPLALHLVFPLMDDLGGFAKARVADLRFLAASSSPTSDRETAP